MEKTNPNTKQSIKRVLSFIVIAILTGTVLLGVGLFLMQQQAAATILSQSLKAHHIQFAAFRYGLIGTLLMLWPKGIHILGKRNGWDAEFIQTLSSKRLYLCGFFIVFELVVVYNVIGALLARLI